LLLNTGPGEIAKELGISHKTVETHFEHIKVKLGYPNAEGLKRGARESLGTAVGKNPLQEVAHALFKRDRAPIGKNP